MVGLWSKPHSPSIAASIACTRAERASRVPREADEHWTDVTTTAHSAREVICSSIVCFLIHCQLSEVLAHTVPVDGGWCCMDRLLADDIHATSSHSTTSSESAERELAATGDRTKHD